MILTPTFVIAMSQYRESRNDCNPVGADLSRGASELRLPTLLKVQRPRRGPELWEAFSSRAGMADISGRSEPQESGAAEGNPRPPGSAVGFAGGLW